MSVTWAEIFKLSRKDGKVPDRLLVLDPGNTTGYALFKEHTLSAYGEVETIKDDILRWDNLFELFDLTKPTYVVCENYRIYQQKLARHSFSPVHTLRLIGGIDLCSWNDRIPIHYQMASQAKAFVTDDKLKEWGFWKEGMRHSRDAIRHGLYFLLFHNRGKDVT